LKPRPSHDRRVRNRQTTLGHYFGEVSKAEFVTQVPAHAMDDNFAIEVALIGQSVNVLSPYALARARQKLERNRPAHPNCTTTLV
jgi:hypothetical protein